MSEQELAGKQILVTGASRGIGLVTARELARRGARILLVARESDALGAAAGSLDGEGHRAFPLDVVDADRWREFQSEVDNESIDGLVTAAGVIGPIGPVGSWDVADFRSTFEINVTGTLLAIVAALPALKRSEGSIVTFSGGGAQTSPLPRFDAYAASKAAVVRLTENIANDLESDGVRVNAIAPGFIVTDIHDATIAAGPDLVGRSYFERTERAIAEGGGDDPQLAADLAAFLISPASSGVTGKLISARWDPWRDPDFLGRLRADPDFCTIRRIDGQFYQSITR